MKITLRLCSDEKTKTCAAELRNLAIQKTILEEEVRIAAERDALFDSTLADRFYRHYSSNGWKVGDNKMVSWHHSIAGWVVRDGIKKNMAGYCPNEYCNSYNQDRTMYKETDKCVYCGWELKGRV